MNDCSVTLRQMHVHVRGHSEPVPRDIDQVLLDGRQVGTCVRAKGAPFCAIVPYLSEAELAAIKLALAERDHPGDDDATILAMDRKAAFPPPLPKKKRT